MTKIKLNAIEKTVRLYGECRASRRLRGTFDCSTNASEFRNIPVFEGHVNTGGRPVRMLSLKCDLANWALGSAMEEARDGDSPARFSVSGNEIEFVMRRVVVTVTVEGIFGDRRATGTGVVMRAGKAIGTVDVFEPEVSGGDRFAYLTGDDKLLLELAVSVSSGCPCEIQVG